MKRKREPLSVDTANGKPTAIRAGRRVYRVNEILDRWVIQGEWWATEKRREYFRVLTDQGACELYSEGDGWHLTKVLD